jgi:putative ABC transport system permease protein
MVIAGILGCSAILVCAFGIKDSLDYYEKNIDMIYKFKTRLLLSEDITQEAADHLMERFEAEAIMENAVELKANGNKRSGSLLVTDDTKLIAFYDYGYDPIRLPDYGVSISCKMAKLLKVKEGDEIAWHIYGDTKWKSAKIAAIYRTPLEQGITMSKECFNDYGFTFRPTSLISEQEISEESAGVEKLWEKEEMIKSYEVLMEAMYLLIYILILAAVLLAVIVLYNLEVLSFTERCRELSTLKVIGFKTKRLRNLMLTQNIWMTALGILPGIPAGLWLLEYMIYFMGDNLDFVARVRPASYIYSILGTFLISIVINRLFSKRVKNIDMVSALKGVE